MFNRVGVGSPGEAVTGTEIIYKYTETKTGVLRSTDWGGP
jgi:hypothetical protein